MATQDLHVHSHTPRSQYALFQRTRPGSLLRLRGESRFPPPPRLRSFTVLCLQTSPGLRFSTPAGPDVWVDLRSLAGCRLFMSVSGGKDGYLCSQSPSPAGAPKFPGGQGGAVVSGPLSSVAAFPSSSLGCFHKRKGVGTSTHSRGFTRPGLAAVSVVTRQDSVRSPWWSR